MQGCNLSHQVFMVPGWIPEASGEQVSDREVTWPPCAGIQARELWSVTFCLATLESRGRKGRVEYALSWHGLKEEKLLLFKQGVFFFSFLVSEAKFWRNMRPCICHKQPRFYLVTSSPSLIHKREKWWCSHSGAHPLSGAPHTVTIAARVP